MESGQLTFHHDSDVFDYIGSFQAALKSFGIRVLDVTKENSDTVNVVLTNDANDPRPDWSN